jgi:glycerol-3-phosphate acyltransferase PlsY
MHPIVDVIAAVAGYLLGCLPFAVVVGRHYGVDPRGGGDGNPGATNVLRLAGPRAGAAVLVGDAAKGLAAAGAGLLLGGWWTAMIGTFAAMLGHSWPFWSRFRRGGRSVATMTGAELILAPVPGLISWVLFALAIPMFGFRSASAVALLSFPVFLLAMPPPDRMRLAGLGGAYLLLVLRNARPVRARFRGRPLDLRSD